LPKPGKRSLIIVVLCLATLAGLAGGVYAYDSGRRALIAQGVTIGGIDVGGLSRAAADQRVRAELLGPLTKPIVVESGGRTWKLGARESRIAADIPAMVDRAVTVSRRGWLLPRVVRSLTGGHVYTDIPAPVAYSDAAVIRLLDRVRRALDKPAVNAGLLFNPTGFTKLPSRDGLAVQAGALHRAIRAAIVDPSANRTFVAPLHKVTPKITTRGLARAYPAVVVIDRTQFRLRLFKHLRLKKTYPIAVGRVGLETPAGLYHVQWKEVNPVWHVPKRSWAGDLAGKTIPAGDPRNPLKARWLAIYDGAGIHGTSDDASIGSAASHGCIRMHIPDVIELYPQVPVGAPVYIA
jgi:lipoprotein-anchoring transpeptidase ErfK/SrfK